MRIYCLSGCCCSCLTSLENENSETNSKLLLLFYTHLKKSLLTCSYTKPPYTEILLAEQLKFLIQPNKYLLRMLIASRRRH